MACLKPIKAYHSYENRTANGKGSIMFSRKSAGLSNPIMLPCGQCIGCRIDRSRAWALRCVHEASLFRDNCFITLTFNEDSVNSNGSLVKSDFQKFMKRLRKRFKGSEAVISNGVESRPIRFFHCGEYGEQLSRPHHHACLFNFDFPDKEIWTVREGIKLYRSKALEELWPYGYSAVGDVTWQSAAYVARYIVKKVTGDDAQSYYASIDKETGEFYYKEPEYITMSRRPGIGYEWFKRYKNDVFPKDFITYKGEKFPVPAYYDKLYSNLSDKNFLEIKKKRLTKAMLHVDNNTMWRLHSRLKCMEGRIKHLFRGYENGDANFQHI